MSAGAEFGKERLEKLLEAINEFNINFK